MTLLMNTTIWHNPRCSKSRQTLALLEEHGIQPTILKYLDTPPDSGTIASVVGQLGISPRDLLRRGEAEYKELGLNNPAISDQELFEIMSDHPKLIERPIVIQGNQARLGRPPENVLEIL